MNILDEDIIAPEHERLRAWRIHFKAIGLGVGRLGMKDQDQIIPLLHQHPGSIFFTRGDDFYRPTLRHPRYCLAYLDVGAKEVADYIRRFLRHPTFRTQAERMGKVVRVRHNGVTDWLGGEQTEHVLRW